MLAPRETAKGARRAVLNATPLPAEPEPPVEVKPLALFQLPEIGLSEPLPAQPKPIAPKAPARHAGPKRQPAKRSAGPGKQERLIKLALEDHGLATLPLDQVSGLATKLATDVDLHPATARRVLLGHARELQNGGAK